MTLRIAFPHGPSRPLVLGHRGASALAPENTCAAFALALSQGADGFELDVWRCGSGEVVVIHDEDARRVAGSPARVTAEPLEGLRALDVGSWRGPAFRGERIPLLQEVLEKFPSAVVNVELKAGSLPDPRLAAAAARVLRSAGAASRVVVSSFSAFLLGAFRLAAPEIPTGFLVDRRRVWRARAALCTGLLQAPGLHPSHELITPERARRWTRRGLSLAAWTVDEPEEVERLCSLGVAALITNVPGRTREVVRRISGR